MLIAGAGTLVVPALLFGRTYSQSGMGSVAIDLYPSIRRPRELTGFRGFLLCRGADAHGNTRIQLERQCVSTYDET